jgi:hypothetical protein
MRSVAKISQPYRSKLCGKVAKNIPHNKRRLREPIGTEIPTGVTPETGVASASIFGPLDNPPWKRQRVFQAPS